MVSFCKIFYVSFTDLLALFYFLYWYFMGSDLNVVFTQVSPGTTRFFLSIYLPHLSLVIPCSYWASVCYAVLPSRKTLYVISFRQTRDLPVVSLFPHPASFRFPSRGHPCLRLYPSHCRVDSGLAPIRNVRRQAHIKKEPLIFIIRNSFSFTHFLKYNIYFIILHIIHFFRSYVFHYFYSIPKISYIIITA